VDHIADYGIRQKLEVVSDSVTIVCVWTPCILYKNAVVLISCCQLLLRSSWMLMNLFFSMLVDYLLIWLWRTEHSLQVPWHTNANMAALTQLRKGLLEALEWKRLATQNASMLWSLLTALEKPYKLTSVEVQDLFSVTYSPVGLNKRQQE